MIPGYCVMLSWNNASDYQVMTLFHFKGPYTHGSYARCDCSTMILWHCRCSGSLRICYMIRSWLTICRRHDCRESSEPSSLDWPRVDRWCSTRDLSLWQDLSTSFPRQSNDLAHHTNLRSHYSKLDRSWWRFGQRISSLLHKESLRSVGSSVSSARRGFQWVCDGSTTLSRIAVEQVHHTEQHWI